VLLIQLIIWKQTIRYIRFICQHASACGIGGGVAADGVGNEISIETLQNGYWRRITVYLGTDLACLSCGYLIGEYLLFTCIASLTLLHFCFVLVCLH